MNTLIINKSTHVPLDAIQYIEVLTDKDREKTVKKYGAEAERFNSRIVYINGTNQLAEETIEDFKDRGVIIVELTPCKQMPAANVLNATPLTEDRLTKMKESGYTLNHEFKSSVKTTNKNVLSVMPFREVLSLRDRALKIQPSGMK